MLLKYIAEVYIERLSEWTHFFDVGNISSVHP